MGIPSVPKFNIPNLCGASAAMNDMLKKKDELMKELEIGLELDASVLKDKMDIGLKDLQQKIKKLAPEMPALPALSLQSELKSLTGISQATASGKILHDLKKLELSTKFGAALEAAGSSFGAMAKAMETNILGGGSGCNCGIPNMLIGGDGVVKEKPENPVTPTKETEGEDKSTVIVPAKVINTAMSNGVAAFKAAAPVMLGGLKKVVQNLTATDGVITEETLQIAREADAKIKSQIGETHPQIKKTQKAYTEYGAFNTVDKEKAIAEPEETTAKTSPSGVGDQKVSLRNDEILVEQVEKEFVKLDSELTAAIKRISMALRGMSKEFPENISEELDADTDNPTIMVWMPSGDYSKDKIRFERNIRVAGNLQRSWRKQMKRLIGKYKPTLKSSRFGAYTPHYLDRFSEEILLKMGGRIEQLDRRYSDFLGEYSVECPEPGEPRGPKLDTDAIGKLAILNAHSNFISLGFHQSGLKRVRTTANPELGPTVFLGPSYKFLGGAHGNGIRRDPQLGKLEKEHTL